MLGVASNFNGFYQVSSGDQCDTIAAKYGIFKAQFKSWSSQVDASTIFIAFSNLWLDYYVGVHVLGATYG
jgi:hypothetical protein